MIMFIYGYKNADLTNKMRIICMLKLTFLKCIQADYLYNEMKRSFVIINPNCKNTHTNSHSEPNNICACFFF